MKVICFYLPQYHPIPENDKWWGKGFTDWVKVAQARPRFKGHYQPHLPADLGFYDLRLEETRIEQAKMALQYGISGFCYYHYWFNTKVLLERPFNEVLQSGKPDLPFCLCWANENWTRTWDGQDQQVLIRQNYDEYDCNQHIEWLEKAFSDKRYIKVDGKPLFLIYCASDIPNIGQKISTWTETIIGKGYPGLYLCSVKSFQNKLSDTEAKNLGFDAVVDFQPNLRNVFKRYGFLEAIKRLANKFYLYRFVSRFEMTNVFSYKRLAQEAIDKPKSRHIVIPCVMPSWDNSARRKISIVIQNNDANLYRKWLENALYRVKHYPPDQQIVFINSWNEWAEGCHLEPDQKNGKKFLQATKEALDNFYGKG